MAFQEGNEAQQNAYGPVVPAADPARVAAIASLRATLICTIILGTFIPFVSFICGIVLLVKSGLTSPAQGLVAVTGILALFWMPLITAIFAMITLSKLDNGF